MSLRNSRKQSTEADEWHPLFDAQGHITGEYAEVCFVPNRSATTKKGEPYRYMAIRERMNQPHLPGMLPFQTVTFANTQYKLFGIVTNMDWEGESSSAGTMHGAASLKKPMPS